jgi:MFS transporter, FSR family, fosmidomycin resistance protein
MPLRTVASALTLHSAGALRARSALLLVAGGHLVIELSTQFLPVLYSVARASMGLTFTQVGTISLVAITCTSLAQPVFGYLSDRWGAERLSALSVIWIGVIMGLVGFAWSYPSLLLLIALGTLGSAAFHPPSAVIAAANAGNRQGAGLSIFSVGGNIGSALSPLLMAGVFALMGLPGTVVLIPLGIGGGVFLYLRLRSIRIAAAAAPQPVAVKIRARPFLLGLTLIVVAMMFRSWYQVALTTYLPIWVEDEGGTVVAGAQMLAIFAFAISAGSFFGGPAGDRFGHSQVVAIATGSLVLFHWLVMHNDGLLQVVALVFSGIAIGATYPTSIIMAIETWPGKVGVASGLLMGLGWWPGGLGAQFTGYLADRTDLAFALQTLLLPSLIGFILILVYAARRQKIMVKDMDEA